MTLTAFLDIYRAVFAVVLFEVDPANLLCTGILVFAVVAMDWRRQYGQTGLSSTASSLYLDIALLLPMQCFNFPMPTPCHNLSFPRAALFHVHRDFRITLDVTFIYSYTTIYTFRPYLDISPKLFAIFVVSRS